jgi:putative peptide zinc metalloprotease protein
LVAAEADGESDFEQIALRVSKDFGRTVSADNVRFFVEERLRPLGVLAATNGSSAKLPRAKPALALRFRTPLVPEGVVQAFTAVFRPLFFAPVVIVMLAGFAALDFWLFFIHGISQSAVELLYRPENFLVVFGLAILSASFHELGHATACRYGGANPGRIGVGIYIAWPVFYNDVTDAYRLSKAGRLRVDLGGVYFNAIFVLATAGAYFLTKSEPLLFACFIQQLGMLYQFMPFVRLDGYYLVSDLTGVPDLFARIKPTLKSVVPGRRPNERMRELKPWVRVVVTAWVLTTIPALLYLFATLAINAPLMYTTAWDSFFVHYDKVRSALGDGRVVEVMGGLVQIVLLIIPVAGVTLTFALFGKRLSGALWSWFRGILSRWTDKGQGRGTPDDLTGSLVSLLDPSSRASEAYRTLRANLLYAFVDHPPQVIVVSSPGSEEGKSTTCANLGVALAQVDKNVLIVDGDLRRPAMHRIFGVSNAFGLVSVLVGERGLQDACQEVLPGLRVLTAGPAPPNPAELLSSRRYAELVRRLRGDFDYVLVDTPPMDRVSDPVILAIHGDGILLVVDARNTRKGSVRRSMKELEAVGANVLGTVMNNGEVAGGGSYGGYLSPRSA